MNLYYHSNPAFTKWIVAEGLLHQPLTVIDVGCQGGPHPRWDVLGQLVDFHGFDPIAEVIDGLSREYQDRSNYHFHLMALGNEDAHRPFFVRSDSFSSSFYSTEEIPATQTAGVSGIRPSERLVEIRKLDSLFAESRIPSADYIKMDCEGFECEVLRGAQNYLADSRPLCVSTETNFNVSPSHSQTHFVAVNELLLPQKLLLYDLAYSRDPYPVYSGALSSTLNEFQYLRTIDVVGRPSTFDILFCRNLVAERGSPQNYLTQLPSCEQPSVDQIIKAMINFELHGLMDCAFEIAICFRDIVEKRFDVSYALQLLLASAPEPRGL